MLNGFGQFAMCYRKLGKTALVVLLPIIIVGCNRSPQAREAKYLQRGQAQIAKKDYSRAILEFQNAAQAMPRDAEPYYQIALAYLQTGNLTMAVPALRKAIQLNPKHSGAQLKLAELMTGSQNKELVQQAAGALQSLLASSPDNAEAIDTLAIAEFQLGKTEDATKRLEEALKKFPAHLQSSVALARLKLAQKDLSGAETVLKQAVASAPQSSAAALALAQLYLLSRQPDKAEPQVRRALQLEPKNAPALLSLASIQFAGKRMGEAEQTYQQLSALPDKTYRSVHAMFLYQTGKKDAGLAEMEKLAHADPADRTVRTRLLAMYFDMGKIPQAQSLLASVLKKNPKDTDALFQRSQLSMKLGKPADAANDLREVLHVQPNFAEAHLALATVYQAEGLAKNHEQELNEALRLNPGLLQARLALASGFIRKNQPQTALEILDQTPQAQKKTVGVVVNRNWALLEAGKRDEVRAILEKALPASGRMPELLLQDAALRLQERDFQGARLSAEEALKRSPEDVRAAQLVAASYFAQDDPAKALQRLSEIAAARPHSAPLQQLLGQSYVQTGHLAEARKAFEAAKAADFKLSGADLALADLDRRENHSDAAKQRLIAIVKANPKNEVAHLMLAELLGATGDQASSIAEYRSVLALNGSDVFALNNLAYALGGTSPDEALKYAQQAAELAPDNAAVQDTLGWIYYRKGIYQSAVNYLKAAVAKEPTPRRQFHLAMSYLKAGDRELGQKTLQTALAKDPDLPKKEQGW
jgi:tetratricopeptide (TPR) repeat protein